MYSAIKESKKETKEIITLNVNKTNKYEQYSEVDYSKNKNMGKKMGIMKEIDSNVNESNVNEKQEETENKRSVYLISSSKK